MIQFGVKKRNSYTDRLKEQGNIAQMGATSIETTHIYQKYLRAENLKRQTLDNKHHTQMNKKLNSRYQKVVESARVKGRGDLIDSKLMDELAASGEKFTEEAVEMVTKNIDGELLWLETGSESAGLSHIMKHEADLLAKGVDVTDIPGFIKNDLLTQVPTLVGRNAKGPYAEYLINGNKFRLAYGDNGFIVSLFPIN